MLIFSLHVQIAAFRDFTAVFIFRFGIKLPHRFVFPNFLIDRWQAGDKYRSREEHTFFPDV